MIDMKSLTSAGTFTRTHGIHGELNAILSVDADYFDVDPCFVCDTDGILVPYFVESLRTKGAKGVLIKPEDVKSETQAKPFVGKTIYIDKESYARFEAAQAGDEDFDEAEGFYADDLAGYAVYDTEGRLIGEITGIETSTANMLFILRTPEDKTLYIPVAEEFIAGIDNDDNRLTVDLPDGLVDLVAG